MAESTTADERVLCSSCLAEETEEFHAYVITSLESPTQFSEGSRSSLVSHIPIETEFGLQDYEGSMVGDRDYTSTPSLSRSLPVHE